MPDWFTQAALVGLGGFCGAIVRAGAIGLARSWSDALAPLGTLGVNIAGCLLAGMLVGTAKDAAGLDGFRWFMLVGFTGSLTTLSAFGLDTRTLYLNHGAALAGANIAANVALGIAAVFVGVAIGQRMV